MSSNCIPYDLPKLPADSTVNWASGQSVSVTFWYLEFLKYQSFHN